MAEKKIVNLLLDCIICGEGRAKNSPRVLACKHGFCQQCLVDTKTINLAGQIQCPVCWKKTPLTQDGVKGLPADEKVLIADHAFQMSKKAQSCELCLYRGNEKVAFAHCADCQSKLCQDCVTVHRKKETLAGHVIVEEICKIHFRDFTHACFTCYSGLCYMCVMSEFHDDHDVCEMVDAKDKATSLMVGRQKLLQEEILDIDKKINFKLDQSIKELNERRKKTEEKLDVYKTKMLESITGALDERDQEFQKSVTESLEKQNQASSHASNCLNDMRMDKDQGRGKLNILNIISRTSVDMFSAVNGIRTNKYLEITIPKVDEDCCDITEDTTEGEFEFKVKIGQVGRQLTEQKPKHQLSIKQLSSEDKPFSSLWSVHALPDGSALLADSNTNYAVKVNVKGEVVCRYKSADGGKVRGLATYNNDIHIGSQDGNIISVTSGGQTQTIHLKAISSCTSALVVEENHLIVVDRTKSLQRYSRDGELIHKLATGCFYSATTAEYLDVGKVYIVTDFGKNQMHVYRPDGSLIRLIGNHGTNDGELSGIGDAAVLPNGNILVANRNLYRISEFKCDGTFVRHLLTQVDGINRPFGLSVSYPYLWVACRDKAMMFKW